MTEVLYFLRRSDAEFALAECPYCGHFVRKSPAEMNEVALIYLEMADHLRAEHPIAVKALS